MKILFKQFLSGVHFRMNRMYIKCENTIFEFQDVPGDGLCFFHSILRHPYLSARFHTTIQLRHELAQRVMEMYHQNSFVRFVFQKYLKDFRLWHSTMSSLRRTCDTWGTNFECVLINLVFGVNVKIVSQNPYEHHTYKTVDAMVVLHTLY